MFWPYQGWQERGGFLPASPRILFMLPIPCPRNCNFLNRRFFSGRTVFCVDHAHQTAVGGHAILSFPAPHLPDPGTAGAAPARRICVQYFLHFLTAVRISPIAVSFIRTTVWSQGVIKAVPPILRHRYPALTKYLSCRHPYPRSPYFQQFPTCLVCPPAYP